MHTVSVIMPLYNAARYVGDALDSALAQTHRPYEIIVVDDGSTDGGADVVQPYVDEHGNAVRLIRKENEGVSKARNVGFEQTTGEFVAFLDADDLWLPTKLEKQIALFAKHPEAMGTHTRCFNFEQAIDDHGREETEKSIDDPSLSAMILHHWVVTSSAVVRRAALEKFSFPEDTGHAEDMVLFADIRTLGPWRLVDEKLLAKRIHPSQATAKPWHRLWAIETRLRWLCDNRAQFDAQTFADVEKQITSDLVAYLENRYWRRQLDDLPQMITFATKLAPAAMKTSFLSSVRIYPRWLYRLRDAVSGRPPAAT